jgi:hypothetical protein
MNDLIIDRITNLDVASRCNEEDLREITRNMFLEYSQHVERIPEIHELNQCNINSNIRNNPIQENSKIQNIKNRPRCEYKPNEFYR